MPRNRPKQSANPTPKQEETPADTDDSETGEGGKFTTNEQSEEPEYTELDQAHEQIASFRTPYLLQRKGTGDEEKQKHSV